VPGFTIDTRSEGSDDNGKPHVELYYAEDSPVSLIQRTAVESIDEYDTTVYDVSEETGKVQSRQVGAVPTTIALDGGYEIERWQVPTHADHIRDVLENW
jgi:hypothetical protein